MPFKRNASSSLYRLGAADGLPESTEMIYARFIAVGDGRNGSRMDGACFPGRQVRRNGIPGKLPESYAEHVHVLS